MEREKEEMEGTWEGPERGWTEAGTAWKSTVTTIGLFLLPGGCCARAFWGERELLGAAAVAVAEPARDGRTGLEELSFSGPARWGTKCEWARLTQCS